MTRPRVFLLRLAASVGLLLPVFAIVRLLWYPDGYFSIMAADTRFLLLAAAAFVIGPVLSAFVFKPGKASLRFDLGVLAAVELAAVVAAASMLYLQRPYYTVFAVDRFEAVTLGAVDLAGLPADVASRRPGHEPRLVYAKMPDDPDVVSQLIDETVLQGLPDIDRRPTFWRPYQQAVPAIRAVSRPLADLLAGDGQRATRVQRWLKRRDHDTGTLRFLPIRGRAGDGLVIIDSQTGYPLATLAVDPW